MKYLGMLLLFLFCAAPAWAEMAERAGVQADLPQGWDITDSQSGNNILSSSNIILTSADKEGQIILSIFNINETGAESLAQGTSEQLKGSTPEAADGGYRFFFEVSGTDKAGQPFQSQGRTFVGGKGKLLGSLTCIGATPDLKAVLYSLKGMTQDNEELMQSLRLGMGFLVP